MKRFVVIENTAALAYWFGLNPNVELTAERMEHIRQHHPEDYDLCMKHVDEVITAPDLILEDHKNPMTAMFIRSFGAEGINVVVKLTLLSDDDHRSFIVTVHPVGERSIKKLERKNKVVYNRSNNMI